MRGINIIGIAQRPVLKQAPQSIRQLGAAAVLAALADAQIEQPGALFVGNALSGILSHQHHLGALIADAAGLTGIEAATAETASSSGAAAMRWGVMAIASGLHDVVVVVGVEKMSDGDFHETTRALATGSDWELEGAKGESLLSLNAAIMQAYIQRYRVDPALFAAFSINAHSNALANPYALFHKAVDQEIYQESRVVVPPLRLYDAAPICDGAAAVVLASDRVAGARHHRPSIRVRASAVATDKMHVSHRRDSLHLQAVALSTARAYAQAGVGPRDIDLFELHDAFSIMAALALEGAGFAPPGEGVQMAADGEIGLRARLPVSTFGGLKARGHPVGASGVYQIVELTKQLSGQAGPNQVANSRIGMAQNVGGAAATVFTHILDRLE